MRQVKLSRLNASMRRRFQRARLYHVRQGAFALVVGSTSGARVIRAGRGAILGPSCFSLLPVFATWLASDRGRGEADQVGVRCPGASAIRP